MTRSHGTRHLHGATLLDQAGLERVLRSLKTKETALAPGHASAAANTAAVPLFAWYAARWEAKSRAQRGEGRLSGKPMMNYKDLVHDVAAHLLLGGSRFSFRQGRLDEGSGSGQVDHEKGERKRPMERQRSNQALILSQNAASSSSPSSFPGGGSVALRSSSRPSTASSSSSSSAPRFMREKIARRRLQTAQGAGREGAAKRLGAGTTMLGATGAVIAEPSGSATPSSSHELVSWSAPLDHKLGQHPRLRSSLPGSSFGITTQVTSPRGRAFARPASSPDQGTRRKKLASKEFLAFS